MFKRGLRTGVLVVRLAWRSLGRNRRRTLINIVSIGMGLSVALVIISLSEGVYHQVVEDGVRLQAGHLAVEHPAYRQAPSADLTVCRLDKVKHHLHQSAAVAHLKPLILGQGVAKSGLKAVGVAVMGVAPEVERQLSPLARRLVAGDYLTEGDAAQVVLGSRLAQTLNVAPGKKVILTTNNAAGNLVEELFRVKGIFQVGAEEVDSHLLQISLTQARHLFGVGADCLTQLGVVLRHDRSQAGLRRDLDALIDRERQAVRPWQEISPDLAAHVRLDRAANWVFQGLLLVIILFTILNTLLMSCLEREKEFAVLLALGTPRGLLKAQLLLETLILGLGGCALGVLLGGGLALILQTWGLNLAPFLAGGGSYSGVAVATHVYARLTPALLLDMVTLFLGATLVLGFLPWRRLHRLRLVELLR